MILNKAQRLFMSWFYRNHCELMSLNEKWSNQQNARWGLFPLTCWIFVSGEFFKFDSFVRSFFWGGGVHTYKFEFF